MNTESSKLAQSLSELITIQLPLFDEIKANSWGHKTAPDKWSKKEILGHLIDSAMNNMHRFVRIQYDDQTNIYYDQDFWVKANDYQNQDYQSVIELWKLTHFQIVRTWANILDDQLDKKIPVKDEHPTLRFLMEDYINHLDHHLQQITQ